MVPYQRKPVARFEPDVTQMDPAAKGAPAQQGENEEWERKYEAPHR